MMIAFICHMLNGTTEKVYAYKFLGMDGDAAMFDIGANSEYIKFGVERVE